MANWLQSLILGIVQGVTEFVPVSSSGHLVLLPYLAGWDAPGLAFDVALHVGTALAVMVYFRRELVRMAIAAVRPSRDPESVLYRRLLGLLILGSIPVAIAGLTLKSVFEEAFTSPLVVSGLLLVTAAILTLGERARTQRVARGEAQAAPRNQSDNTRVWDGDWMGQAQPVTASEALPDVETGFDADDHLGMDLRQMNTRQAVLIGLGQTLALFPGLSRSGATITAGLFAGLTRAAATRFSFLLALPALVGAAIVSLPDLADQSGGFSGGEIIVGVVAAFVSGYLTVSWLVKLVSRESLTIFVRYLIAAAVIGLFGYLMNGPVSSV